MRLFLLSCLGFLVPSLAVAQPRDDPQQLALQAKNVFTTYCYRCHGQNGSSEGGFDYILDFKKLVGKKVIAGDATKSRLFKRLGIARDMPPDYEPNLPMPRPEEIDLVKRWIEAGAPLVADEKLVARQFVTVQDELKAMHDHLRKADRNDRKHIRFFSLRHLHNMPPDLVLDRELPLYQAALAKLVNSLSWKKQIVVPEAVDAQRTVFAIDIRKLDWDGNHLWNEIIKLNPYGLKHDHYPDLKLINDLADDVYRMADTVVPLVRADWFVATASRPPLYHALLQIPTNAHELERKLGVDALDNIRKAQVKRGGFNGSGVSGNNRLVERHEALHGAYWKSYDFKSGVGLGNLFVYPLGPRFDAHPFERQAFKHDGGELIFNLPNGLQGYMLVDAKDQRIDAGPVEVVSDAKKISGTPLVVNGLSCMSCHRHGMIPFEDQVRAGHILGGNAGDFVRRIFPEVKEMNVLLARDERRFMSALEEATAGFLKVGPDAKKDLRDFPESISAIARWYQARELTSLEVARELGLDDTRKLEGAIAANARLQEIGLYPLANGKTIKREVWENTAFLLSPFQETAKELKLGVPVIER